MFLDVNDEIENLSDEDIREEVDTLMFAGHDTSASTVKMALYSIAAHEEVQVRIQTIMKL